MINVIVNCDYVLIGSNCSNGQDENPAIQIANGGKELKDVVESKGTHDKKKHGSLNRQAGSSIALHY